MPPDEPEFSNWKDAWEWHATQTHEDLRTWQPADLLRAADAGHYDAYYTLWSAIRERCTLAEAAPVLLRVIRREAGESLMLIRYHAAGALFGLLGYPDDPLPVLRARVMWPKGDESARLRACDELEALCRARVAAGG
jgi:hypothetical protein